MLFVRGSLTESSLVEREDCDTSRSEYRVDMFVAANVLNEAVHEDQDSLWRTCFVSASIYLRRVWASYPRFRECGRHGMKSNITSMSESRLARVGIPPTLFSPLPRPSST
jgi:hypothetical protein